MSSANNVSCIIFIQLYAVIQCSLEPAAKVKPPEHVPEPRVLVEYLQDLDIREVRLFVFARAVTRDVVLSFVSLSSTGGRREIWKYSVAYPVQVCAVKKRPAPLGRLKMVV